jgi:hypothetical protein
VNRFFFCLPQLKGKQCLLHIPCCYHCPRRFVLLSFSSVSLLTLLPPILLSPLLFYLFIYCGAGAWTQGLRLEPLHQPYFCVGFFKIGSLELFAWAGFKPWSSWSLPPEQLALQTWATGTPLPLLFLVHIYLSPLGPYQSFSYTPHISAHPNMTGLTVLPVGF